jgi:hypothetical protein
MHEAIGKWVIPFGIFLAAATAFYLNWPKPAPPDNFYCDFRAPEIADAPAFGKLQGAITTIIISSRTSATSQQTLFNLKGQAVVSTATAKIEAPASGLVFIDPKDNPNGLMLEIDSAVFAPDGLHVMTLGKDGVVELNSTRAFVLADPKPDSPKRLSYPVSMNCRANSRK